VYNVAVSTDAATVAPKSELFAVRVPLVKREEAEVAPRVDVPADRAPVVVRELLPKETGWEKEIDPDAAFLSMVLTFTVSVSTESAVVAPNVASPVVSVPVVLIVPDPVKLLKEAEPTDKAPVVVISPEPASIEAAERAPVTCNVPPTLASPVVEREEAFTVAASNRP